MSVDSVQLFDNNVKNYLNAFTVHTSLQIQWR